MSGCLSSLSSGLYEEFDLNISTENDVITFFSYLAQLSAFTKKSPKCLLCVMLCLVFIAANEDPNKTLLQNVEKKGLGIHFPQFYTKEPKDSYFPITGVICKYG